MSALRDELIRAIADGSQYNIDQLAQSLNADARVIDQAIASLPDIGLSVEHTSSKIAQLARPLKLLDRDAILAAAGRPAALNSLDVFGSITSTNAYLLKKTPPPVSQVDACLAEHQSEGRGRRNRRWESPYGSGVWLSVGRSFVRPPSDIGAFSLAAGVAARRALLACDIPDIGLKWPNDIAHRARKLGGILVELRQLPQNRLRLVAGIGINVTLPDEARRHLAESSGTAATDLAAIAAGHPPDRSHLAGTLIKEMFDCLAEFESAGFAPFADEWREADVTDGVMVEVLDGGVSCVGTARGIDTDGALLVESSGSVRRFVAGEVSVRLKA